MKVTSKGIVSGIIADKYGKRGTQFNAAKMATYSLPLKIEDAPEGTAAYALVLEDKDAIPVCGYSWIHWTVADLRRTELLENESISATDFVQGTTSWSGLLSRVDRMTASVYGGMAPPNAPHVYELHVYALDALLGLETGFYMNELFKAMEEHVLASCTLKGSYAN